MAGITQTKENALFSLRSPYLLPLRKYCTSLGRVGWEALNDESPGMVSNKLPKGCTVRSRVPTLLKHTVSPRRVL